MTKIFSVFTETGGAGKTSVIVNGAYYLAHKKNQKVLLIDQDENCSASTRFFGYQEVKEINREHREQTVLQIFNGERPQPVNVSKNIDLIVGSPTIKSHLRDIEQGQGRQYLLNVIKQNLDLFGEYNYILIDTHNDKTFITDNALVVSDRVVAVSLVDSDAIRRLEEAEEYLGFLKKNVLSEGKPVVRAAVVGIGNNIPWDNDGRTFKEMFTEAMKQNEALLGWFERRSAIQKLKTQNRSLVEVEKKSSEKDYFEKIWDLYDKIFE